MATFDDVMTAHRKREGELAEKFGDDFMSTARSFEINKAERGVIAAWLEELEPEIMAIQGPNPLGEDGPYYGAVGGGVTYTFTPTGLGDILVVKETTTGKELNVTQALDWHFYG